MLKQFKNHFPAVKAYMDEPLHRYTYTRTGGLADLVCFPKTKDELSELLKWFYKYHIPVTILGNASNLIIRDGGLEGAVVLLSEMRSVQINQQHMIAQAGLTLMELTQAAKDAHLTGLEFACGIPGSVGGAVYMNAGAYGGEIKDVVSYVDVMTQKGELKRLTKDLLQFSYRHSVLQETGDVVVEVCFQLHVGNREEIEQRMDELTHLRESKQPLEYPSCGSVFKRPEGYFAGKLIQDAGLQGYQIGGVQVSTKHAGFMVNVDNGTASDYIRLIEHVQSCVQEKFGVHLEPEVRIIGRK